MENSNTVREIPGYYYDHEKRKYFKIQAHAPPNTAYSSRDVKRRKTHNERTAAIALETRRQKGRIQHSKILEEPSTGGFLKREYGQSLDVTGILAHSLTPRGSLSLGHDSGNPLFTAEPVTDGKSSELDIRLACENRVLCTKFVWESDEEQYCPQVFRTDVFAHQGPCTSLSTHQDSGRTAITWLATTPQAGIAIIPIGRLAGPEEYPAESPIHLFGPGVTRGLDVSMWSSTPAPQASSLLFAFGSSDGILTLDNQYSELSWLTPVSLESSSEDVFALEFLSDNHSVLLSGGRSGILNITDLRVPKFGFGADVINHPSSIIHIKQLDTHRIIVAGLNSSLCQYDLRFRKLKSESPAPRTERLQGRSPPRNSKPTAPILQYLDYHNSASLQLGFDVDLESGIVAAAQEQDECHPAVQLFSLHGGNTLRSPHVSRNKVTDLNFLPRSVRCLKFVGDNEDRGMKSLWMDRGRIIERFSWWDKHHTAESDNI